MNPSTRRLAFVGLLALLPVAAYAWLRADAFAAVAGLNVILIVSTVHVLLNGATEPAPGARGHTASSE